ncbi:family 10 glycosylhydrolase [Spirulina sp. CCNP1310]|uniref:glycoside hydrolase family 10 protein n=1 Tax=Spirulina sp. CCNP1310 TaxID=3110249 RepID=UPI002B21FFDF|nr:family 10 glycosylhydrolase [Spirulina sp. CCNP1310]MEA5421382.1 family 10 glycosylhydrolase [Spirulina sp. CCNP1310]
MVLRWFSPRRLWLAALAGPLLWPQAGFAQALSLAVVQDEANQTQWPGISRRLQAMDIAYCTLNRETFTPQTLPNPANTVLLLVNIPALDVTQALALETWINRGGRVIVTGNTGSLSPEAVQTQLQKLLGATWGFPLSTPAALAVTGEVAVNRLPLSTPLQGGSILPTQPESRVLAHWQTQRPTPAIVATAHSVFLGWRWGNDQIAGVNTDVAWLQTLLQEYGNPARAGFNNARPCNAPASPPLITTLRPEPEPVRTAAPTAPPVRVPPQPPAAHPIPLENAADEARAIATAPTPLRSRYRALTALLNRYESAVIAAEAQAIREPFQATIERLRSRSQPPTPTPALQTARNHLNEFLTLVARQAFPEAEAQSRQLQGYLFDTYPTEQAIAYPETRAIWFDRGTIVRAKSPEDLARIFNRLAEAGINTVFFETVNASYTIYPSRVAPEQNPLTQGWDPLEAAVKLAHERGMELHAWVWLFAAANQRHNEVMGQPLDYLGPVLSRHPDWIASDRQGNPYEPGSGKVFFDPAHPEVRRYLLSLMDEIITRYQVDGIHIDYVRYPFQDPNLNQDYGFGLESRRQFSRQYGVDPLTVRPSDPLWPRWTQFRIAQISSFVEEVHNTIKPKDPDVLISAAVFPMPTQTRLVRLQQNWEAWLQAGHIDFLTPMTYARDTEEFQTLTQPVLGHGVNSGTLLMPGIRLLQLPTVVALDQLQLLRDAATGGYALFAAENLSLNLQTTLNQIQGRRTADHPEPVAHRRPFQTAHLRYQALQREWQYLLTTGEIDIEPAALTDWGNYGDRLETSLANLASNPSPQNLRQAQTALRSLRTYLSRPERRGMTSNYRQRVWENHLIGLEQLLRYGAQQNFR